MKLSIAGSVPISLIDCGSSEKLVAPKLLPLGSLVEWSDEELRRRERCTSVSNSCRFLLCGLRVGFTRRASCLCSGLRPAWKLRKAPIERRFVDGLVLVGELLPRKTVTFSLSDLKPFGASGVSSVSPFSGEDALSAPDEKSMAGFSRNLATWFLMGVWGSLLLKAEVGKVELGGTGDIQHFVVRSLRIPLLVGLLKELPIL